MRRVPGAQGAEGDAKPLRPEDAAPPPAVAGKDPDEYVRFARVVGVPGRNAFQASLVARDEGALALSEFDGLGWLCVPQLGHYADPYVMAHHVALIELPARNALAGALPFPVADALRQVLEAMREDDAPHAAPPGELAHGEDDDKAQEARNNERLMSRASCTATRRSPTRR